MNEDVAKRWTDVKAELKEFRKFLNAKFPKLEIRDGYECAWGYGPEYKRALKERPFQCCGVYLFYDDGGRLLYVGSAMYTFYKRVFKHSHDGVAFIDFIPFDEAHAPFAAALEQFLIRNLRPPRNKVGVGYEPCRLPSPAPSRPAR